MQPTKLVQYQAYSLANQTAPKTRQIVMLYDGAIRSLRQAQEAIEQKQIEQRFNLLVKASDIILGLQGCLDFENGGEIAKLLYNFYSTVDAQILSLHRHPSVEICTSLIAQLKEMRDAWKTIDQQVEHAVAQTNPSTPQEILTGTADGAPVEETPLPSSGVEISA